MSTRNSKVGQNPVVGAPTVWRGGFDRFLTYRLIVLLNMLSRDGQRQFRDGIGMSLLQWRVIAVLATNGPSTAAEVGRILHMDRAEVSRIQTALSQAGLISRAAAPQGRQILSVTAKGRRQFELGRPIAEARQRELQSLLSPEERAVLETVIDKLVAYYLAKNEHDGDSAEEDGPPPRSRLGARR